MIANASPRRFIVIVFAVLLAALSVLPDAARADTLEEKAKMCGGCHGEDGIPQEKTTPVIWGQHQGYLYLNLRDYKRGDRKDDQMTPVVDLLEREDFPSVISAVRN